MTSLVLELQSLAQAGSTDVSELLRRALVVSAKLRLDDFNEWFEHELNGYSATAVVPDYRVVPSQLMSQRSPNPPQPVVFHGEAVEREGVINLAKHFSNLPVRQSIAEVADLAGSTTAGSGLASLRVGLGEGEMRALVAGNEDFLEVEVFRVLSRSSFVAILDSVRNRILRWSLDLERQQILGDGMSFTKEEKAAAAAQITINGSVGSFVQGSGATVTTTQASPGAEVRVAAGSSTTNERVANGVEKIRKSDPTSAAAIERIADAIAKSPSHSAEKKGDALENLATLVEQAALPLENRLSKVVLTPVVTKLRENLSLSADLLQLWSTFGPIIVGLLKL